jgi:hypothetical protein
VASLPWMSPLAACFVAVAPLAGIQGRAVFLGGDANTGRRRRLNGIIVDHPVRDVVGGREVDPTTGGLLDCHYAGSADECRGCAGLWAIDGHLLIEKASHIKVAPPRTCCTNLQVLVRQQLAHRGGWFGTGAEMQTGVLKWGMIE